MKIIIDWDYPYVGKKESLRRVKKYLIHFLSFYLPIKSGAYAEHKEWIEIYAEIEKLSGKKFIYGIRPPCEIVWKDYITELKKEHDVRQHLHMWHADDRTILLKEHGIPKDNEHTVCWFPGIVSKIFVVPEIDIDMDFKLDSEKDITRDVVVFHPDHRVKSIIKLLRLLNQRD